MAEEIGNYFILETTKNSPYTTLASLVEDIQLGKAKLITAGTYLGSTSELEYDKESLFPNKGIKYIDIDSDGILINDFVADNNSYTSASTIISLASTSDLNACLKKVIKI